MHTEKNRVRSAGELLRLAGKLALRRLHDGGRQGGNMLFLVFSRDRPLQLDALLRSARQRISGNARWIALWRASTPDMVRAYLEVFSGEIPEGFEPVAESGFREDLIGILRRSAEAGVIPLVDDLIFVNDFPLAAFAGIDPLREVASLRLGPDVSHCQPKCIDSPPPKLTPSGRGSWLRFSWREASGDWAMPVSLDGHLLDRRELLLLCESLPFKAPNSLEEALGKYRLFFKFRAGLCLAEPVVRNFAFNRVQSENSDFPCGSEWTSERFAGMWNEGWRLDIAAMAAAARKSNACHIIAEPVFERRA